MRALLESGPAFPWAWRSIAWSAGILGAFFIIAVRLYRNITT
jgi:hypothetical protein